MRKFSQLFVIFLLTACTVNVKYKAKITNLNNNKTQYVYAQKNFKTWVENYCQATWILAGGTCWGYLFYPTDSQILEIDEDIKRFVKDEIEINYVEKKASTSFFKDPHYIVIKDNQKDAQAVSEKQLKKLKRVSQSYCLIETPEYHNPKNPKIRIIKNLRDKCISKITSYLLSYVNPTQRILIKMFSGRAMYLRYTLFKTYQHDLLRIVKDLKEGKEPRMKHKLSSQHFAKLLYPKNYFQYEYNFLVNKFKSDYGNSHLFEIRPEEAEKFEPIIYTYLISRFFYESLKPKELELMKNLLKQIDSSNEQSQFREYAYNVMSELYRDVNQVVHQN